MAQILGISIRNFWTFRVNRVRKCWQMFNEIKKGQHINLLKQIEYCRFIWFVILSFYSFRSLARYRSSYLIFCNLSKHNHLICSILSTTVLTSLKPLNVDTLLADLMMRCRSLVDFSIRRNTWVLEYSRCSTLSTSDQSWLHWNGYDCSVLLV